MVHLPIYMHHRKQPNEGKYIPCMDGNGCSLQSFTCSEQTANLPWSSNLARQILPRSPRKSGSWNLNDVSTSVYWGLKPWNKGRLGSSLSNVFQTNTLVWCQHHGAREREREREMPGSWLLLGGLGFHSGWQYDVMISSGWEYLLFSPRELKVEHLWLMFFDEVLQPHVFCRSILDAPSWH